MNRLSILIGLLLILFACKPPTPIDHIDVLATYDSVYTTADIQWHKQYYPLLDQQVFSIDLLSDGLAFDSAHHIVGTGVNLYLSDIFLPIEYTKLQNGTYRMDSTAAPYTFLPYMYFEGNSTGCYMLDIEESQIKRIIGFTNGYVEMQSTGKDIQMNFTLYLADSTCYHATYQGPAIYR